VKDSTPEGEEGDSPDSSSSRVCNNLQLQLLTVARVHEAMAEGLAGGEGEGGVGCVWETRGGLLGQKSVLPASV
jgi:hypothetical protein